MLSTFNNERFLYDTYTKIINSEDFIKRSNKEQEIIKEKFDKACKCVAFLEVFCEKWRHPDTASASPIQQKQEDLGGIDMRHLVKNTTIENRDRPLRGQSLFSEAPSGIDLKELREIQRLIQAGIIPAIKRLEECRGACSNEALLSCIVDILRIEEERVTQTEAGLKNLLASL
jgi:hypothetical protein